MRALVIFWMGLVSSIQNPHPKLHPLGLWVPTHHHLSAGEVEYHGRQITAPAHILASVTLGTGEHSQLYVGVVSQAAVLKDACNHMATADSLFCVPVCLHVHSVCRLGHHCRHPQTHANIPLQSQAQRRLRDSPGDKEAIGLTFGS